MDGVREKFVPRAARPATLVATIGSTCLAASVANGQVGAPGDAAAGPSPGAGPLETVVVTGSRIRSAVDASVAPVVAITPAELERRRADSLGDVLQQLPFVIGNQQNGNVNNGGNGATRLSLRGLGDSRTLVLLNGRRLPNGGVGGDASVDLNAIPTSLVERVEVLTSGGSAIYGADAIAGVVNVITREPEPGFGARAERTLATRGDGEVLALQAHAGAAALGGAWTLGLDYVRQDAVRQDERRYSELPLGILVPGGPLQFRGSNNAGGGQFALTPGNAFGLPPGNYTHVGTPGSRTAANYRLFAPGDAFNFAPFSYLQTPGERGTAWLLGSQPLGAHEVFFEGSCHRRESSQRLAPTPYTTGPGVAPLLANGRPGIPASNFYNPFGIDLTFASRRFVELADRGFDQDVRAWRVLAGVRGDLGRWRYEFAYAEARSSSDVDEVGLLAGVRLAQALGPSGRDANGRVACGRRDPATGLVPAAAVVPGCVPLDLFGGPGSITAEQLAYVAVDLRDGGENRQRLVDLGAEGPFGRLPAGEIRWALGAEYRREAGRYEFDPLRLQGVAGGGGTPLPGGSFDVRELYAELRAPLLADAPFARRLDLTAAVRPADFSTFGRNTTWGAGLHWSPLASLNARLAYNRVYRAPGIDELFRTSAAFGNVLGGDPCSVAASPTPVQRANCAADGVPGGVYVLRLGQPIETVGGGNPDLQPERGSTLNAGLTWTWPAAANLSLSVDWFRIELPGLIQAPNGRDVLVECANLGLPEVCGRTTRNSDGSVLRIDLRPGNFGTFVTRGVDHAGSASFALGGGQFALAWRASWLQDFDGQPFPGATVQRLAGRLGPPGLLPRWRALGDATWQRGGLRLGYTLRYFGDATECGGGVLTFASCRKIGDTTFSDVDASYAFDRGLRVYAGLRNAFDREPPFVNNGINANTDVGLYPVLGRTWFAGAAFEWR